MNIRILRSLVSTPWAIHAGYGNELLENYLNHNKIGGAWTEREESPLVSFVEVESNKTIDIKFLPNETPLAAYQRFASSSQKQSKNTKGYIAIMHVTGPMMKYGDMCSYGMDDRAAMVDSMKDDKDIIGLITLNDSPGGQVAGTANFSNSIKNFGKPTVALVNDGICASANYWFASAHDKVYASTSTCEIGSIGVLCTLYDNEKALNKMGYRQITVYSRLSGSKNKEYNEALKGNLEPMQDSLDATVAEFHKHVESNRTITDKKVLDGAMYITQHAIELGLIDGQKTLSEVIDEMMADTTSSQSVKTGASEITQEIIEENDMEIFNAIAGKPANEITAEELAAITTGLQAAGIENIEIHPAGTVQGLEAQVERIAELEKTNQSLTDQLAALGEGADETIITGGDSQHGQNKEFEPVIKK